MATKLEIDLVRVGAYYLPFAIALGSIPLFVLSLKISLLIGIAIAIAVLIFGIATFPGALESVVVCPTGVKVCGKLWEWRKLDQAEKFSSPFMPGIRIYHRNHPNNYPGAGLSLPRKWFVRNFDRAFEESPPQWWK